MVNAVHCTGVVIHPIPFAESNYCYLVTDEQDAVSILIDPADPEAIQVFLLLIFLLTFRTYYLLCSLCALESQTCVYTDLSDCVVWKLFTAAVLYY